MLNVSVKCMAVIHIRYAFAFDSMLKWNVIDTQAFLNVYLCVCVCVYLLFANIGKTHSPQAKTFSQLSHRDY